MVFAQCKKHFEVVFAWKSFWLVTPEVDGWNLECGCRIDDCLSKYYRTFAWWEPVALKISTFPQKSVLRCHKNQNFVAAKIRISLPQKPVLRCHTNQYYLAAKIMLQKSVLRCRKIQYYVAAKISIPLPQISVLRCFKNQYFVSAKISITLLQESVLRCRENQYCCRKLYRNITTK